MLGPEVGGGRNEERVRTALLARRTEWLGTGFQEDDLPAHLVRAE